MANRLHRTRALCLEVGGWTATAFGLWVATLSAVTLPEACFALGCALVCGICAVATRHALGDTWQLNRRWAGLPVRVVSTALLEAVPTARAALSRDRGRLRHIDLPADSGRSAQARAALLVLGVSATPGALVIHVDNGLGRFVVHDLASSGDGIEEVLADGSVARR